MSKPCYTSILLLLLASSTILNAQSTTTPANTSVVTTNTNETKQLRNKKAAISYFESYQSGDIDAAFKDFDKDVIMYSGGNPKPSKGLDSIVKKEKDGYPAFKNIFPDAKIEITSAAAEGDYVFLTTKMTGTWKGDVNNWKASGKSFDVVDVAVMKFNEDGKVTESRTILPFDEIIKQVFDGVEADLNTAGYDLLGAKKFDEAIEVFKLNVKLYPESANTYDSLGEAYAMAGKNKLAIENYERSIKMNPKNDYGKKMLEKLKTGQK